MDKRSAYTDTEGLMVDAANALSTLHINFEYRTDPDKTGQDAKWQETRLQQAEAAIIQALQDLKASAFLQALQTPAPTDSKNKRTLLGKYLQKYAARNTMDYFIHKDLGGFYGAAGFYIKGNHAPDDIDNRCAASAKLPKQNPCCVKLPKLIAFWRNWKNFSAVAEKEIRHRMPLLHHAGSYRRQVLLKSPPTTTNDEWVKLFAINDCR